MKDNSTEIINLILNQLESQYPGLADRFKLKIEVSFGSLEIFDCSNSKRGSWIIRIEYSKSTNSCLLSMKGDRPILIGEPFYETQAAITCILGTICMKHIDEIKKAITAN